MVRRRNVVVSVCLQTADRVVFFEAVVFDGLGEQILAVGHLLQTGEEAWLPGPVLEIFDCFSHERVTSNVTDTIARLRVGVQDLRDQVLALLRQEFRHLIISRHDLLVQVTGFGVLEGQIPGHHGVKDDSR